MTPEMAQLLALLAHEIRSPLSVSQGYVRLLATDRVPAAYERAAICARTSDALGAIAALCADMNRLAELAELDAPDLTRRVPAGAVVAALAVPTADGAVVLRGGAAHGEVATDDSDDLAAAVTTLRQLVFADAGPDADKVVDVRTTNRRLVVALGAADALEALPPDPHDPRARPVPLATGGYGLTWWWSALVLQRHGAEVWRADGDRRAAALTLPLVTA